jgi:hypothetical protein
MLKREKDNMSIKELKHNQQRLYQATYNIEK